VRTRWINFAAQGKPQGPAGEPEWTAYQQADRACLVIDRRDDVVHDLDSRIQAAWGAEMVSFR
jgi:para-nitrobenzyl esterase